MGAQLGRPLERTADATRAPQWSTAAWERWFGNLHGVTGKREYLDLARRFDKKWFFDALAAHQQ